MNNVSKRGDWPIIELENIHKRYGGVVALRGVDFQLECDQVVGLVGDNGAGKSTLIKIVSGAIPHTEGKIYFKGTEIGFNNPKQAKDLGIETVYQDLALAENLDIASNIFLGRQLTKSRLGKFFRVKDKRTMEEESAKVLKRLKIELDDIRTIVKNLSGGQRQAVAIGKAVYQNPEVIILDEPTANIGVKEREEVLKLISRLKDEEIAVIFISHNLQEVFAVCDKIVILTNGEKVAEKGTNNFTRQEVINYMMTTAEGTEELTI